MKYILGIDLGATIGATKVFMDGKAVPLTIKPESNFMARLDALERIARGADETECLGVVIENPMGRHYNVLRLHMQMLGALVMALHLRRLKCESINLTEIKKAATGKGNAKKPDMIAAAKARFGLEMNEHEADAAHCAAYGWDMKLFE